jgi:C_GCAxxG_C_C family probable redox protein
VTGASDAVACFDGGFNCAQAVFASSSERFGLDRETALRVACGLGAGMGRQQRTCGAVTGAYLLIGLRCGNVSADDRPARERTYALVREFAARFEARNGTTICRELLGVDLVGGDPAIVTERVRAVCPTMVRDAADIVEQLLP